MFLVILIILNLKNIKFGPYAHSIEILSQQIKEFQESYHVNTIGAEAILYNNLISDKVKETIEKYKIPILKSTSFVNSIDQRLCQV